MPDSVGIRKEVIYRIDVGMKAIYIFAPDKVHRYPEVSDGKRILLTTIELITINPAPDPPPSDIVNLHRIDITFRRTVLNGTGISLVGRG